MMKKNFISRRLQSNKYGKWRVLKLHNLIVNWKICSKLFHTAMFDKPKC